MAWKESLPFLFFSLIPALFLTYLAPWLSIPFWLLVAGIAAFFRDPPRESNAGEKDILSAADGRVVTVDEVEAPEYGTGKMKRVAVFLSVLDVHVNRSPCAGRITHVTHRNGSFLDARTQEIDLKNERRLWLIETCYGSVIVSQIAGLIARRIVGWKAEGQPVERGERFGMIRFGSRTDVYLPLECEVLVRSGDIVRGGQTVIARWPHLKS